MNSPTAMAVIGHQVRPGREDDYLQWQKNVIAAASRYPGYLEAEMKPAGGDQTDWTVVYEFDSAPHLENWVNSATRQRLIASAAELFDGPGTRQIITRDDEANDPLVTVVVSHRVDESRVGDFLAWRTKMGQVESRQPGFCGAEVFRPISGVQDEWTTIYRFDTAEHLNTWLNSAQRRAILDEADFGDFRLRTANQSFGSWFVSGDAATPPPSDFKTSIAVWMGLYPTVVLLTLLTAPLHMPFWLAMLVGNLLSSLVMSFLVMPHYGNPILRWWLSPAPGARQPATDIKGIVLVLGINAVWAVVFYLLTVKVGLHS